MTQRLGIAGLATCWLAWGLSYPVTGIALESLDVWSSRALVMLAGGLVMLGLAAVQGLNLRVPRGEWRDLFIAALCNMAIFQICMTYGVELLSAGRTAIIVYTMPVWAALFAVPLLGERLTPARLAALALGLIGLAVMMSQDFSHLKNAPVGALSTLIAAVAFGLGTVWMKRRRWSVSPTVLGGWQLLAGVVPVIAIWAWLDPAVDPAEVSRRSWLAVLFLIFVANALAYFAWFRVVAFFPAIVSGIGTMVVPVVGVFASAVLVDERIGWRELVALALTCAAVAVTFAFPARGTRG